VGGFVLLVGVTQTALNWYEDGLSSAAASLVIWIVLAAAVFGLVEVLHTRRHRREPADGGPGD
jgi:hypothetical protein